MLLSVLAVVLYLAAVGLPALAAAWVRRAIPGRTLAFFALLPLCFLLPDMVSRFTHLPTDHMQLFPPGNSPLAFVPHNPWLNDLATQNLPWTEKVCEALSSGQWPLRDRWNGCGGPLSANNPAAPFSPATLLALALPLFRAYGVAAAAKLFAALCGMWLWLKELHISPAAALFGSVAFAMSFSIVPWLFFPIGAAIALWPWCLFAFERLRDREAAGRALVLLTAVLTAWPLAGHIESVVSGLTLAVLIFALRFACGDLPDARRLLPRLALAGLAAAGLAAFALVPQAFAILASNRRALADVPFYTPHFSWKPHGFVWPGLASTLFPQAFGDGLESPMMTVGAASFLENGLGYFGAAGWAAALLVLRPGSRRARATWALLAALVIGLCVGAGLWPFAEIAGHLPVYRWMFPPRILSWIALCGCAIAALEIDRLLPDLEIVSYRAAVAAAAAAMALALFVLDAQRRYYAAIGPAAGQDSVKEAMAVSLCALAAFAACAALAMLLGPGARQALPYALAAVVGLELTFQASRQYRLWPAATLFPPTPLVDFLARQRGPFRVVGEGSTLFPAVNVFARVEDIRTHDPVERRDYVDFLDSQCGYPPADYFKKPVNLNAPALDFLNVRFLLSMNPRFRDPTRPSDLAADKWRLVYSGPDGQVLENQDALPRVFAPQRVVGVGPPGYGRDRVRSATPLFLAAYEDLQHQADWRQKAFVLGAARQERANGEAEIHDYAEAVSRVTFRVRARGGSPETILVSSLVQDGGWSGRDENGRRLPTTLANGPFLAVSVPDGAHKVVLDYAPPGSRTGLLVSLGTLLCMAVAAVAMRASRIATGH
ncbi:MAG: DUF6044 family protein [Thermoanaerobaculia bacterium]